MIVANATPLIHLARANWLRLIWRLYERVVVPASVWKEVTSPDRPETHVLREAGETWIDVHRLPRGAARLSASLRRATPMGQAEADAIALADSLDLPIVLDDAVAVGVARLRGLTTRWTASIVLEARARGVLHAHEARTAVEDLVRAGLWIRQDVLLRVLEALGERSD